ncbi:MAG: hypothetical protein U1B77_02460 [Dehalococcoidales bacterium]|nr:hypothetical protein [Dehalococcoidales bacterium]
MSYPIATNELTLTDIKAFRGGAVEAGIARGLDLKIATNRNELVVFEALPLTNFGAALYTTEQYITPAPAAVGWASAGNGGGVGTLPVGQVAVFYKAANSSPVVPPVFIASRFRIGATGSSTKAVFQTQLAMENKMESDVYFSEPVVYDPQDRLFIQVYSSVAAGAAENYAFGCFIVSRLGPEIS